jgi:transglutaminase-like putative cysteine protease
MLETSLPLYTLPLAFFTARAGDTRKVSRDSLDQLIAHQVPFLEAQNLDWSTVKRSLFFAYQQFQYVYPSAVEDLSQRLLVKPRANYGGQRLLDFKLAVEPIPLSTKQAFDNFENTTLELEVAHISHWTSFEVMFCIENTVQKEVIVSPEQIKRFKVASSLTQSNPQILKVAQKLQNQSGSEFEFAKRASDWVSHAMQYKSGLTTVQTTATQAFEIGAGLCQDYSHLFIALCRAVGVAARYVSGHMVGEGGSHAWAEVLLEQPNGLVTAIGFDPTNARQPNLGYTVVALGRDYNDVPPTSGRFMGDSAGVLHFEKHAGLLELELLSGEILSL